MTAESDAASWADCAFADDLDIHEVDPERFADVYPRDDGSVLFDEGWGDAFVESDTVVEVRR